MASSRLLLPWPLSPKKTLKRGPGERSRSARLRKPRTRSRSTRSADMPLDAHRHHDADEARRRVADRLENARIELARELQRDLVLAQRSEHVEQRSEEHTSELQSRENLVCRLLLEKK